MRKTRTAKPLTDETTRRKPILSTFPHPYTNLITRKHIKKAV